MADPAERKKWVRLLAYITGLVNAEDRILRAHLPSRLRLSDPQRSTLAKIGKRLGRKNKTDSTVGAKSEPEFVCEKVGSISEKGMPVEADPVR